jgi:hypothetical protein
VDASACNDKQDTEEVQSDEVSCEEMDDVIDIIFGHEGGTAQEVQSPSQIPAMLH